MANAQTEHSRKLRAKTASEWAKKQIAEGKIKQVKMDLSAELAGEFDALVAEQGTSRPKTLKMLIDFYRSHQ